MCEHAWAVEEFGSTKLGDVRRTRRLVDGVALLAGRPGGTVRGTFGDGAEAEGVYRLLESDGYETQEYLAASGRAAVLRCRGEPFVYVAGDGSSLTVGDRSRKREVGRIGTKSFQARGLEVMTSMVIDRAGTPVGLVSQRYWRRLASPTAPKRKRRIEEKETRYWLEVIEDCRRLFAQPGAPKPWHQMDRGADFREMLQYAADAQHCWITVRASHNRKLVAPERDYLRAVMERQPVLGHLQVAVPARDKPRRTARMATLELRAQRVCVRLRNRWLKTHRDVWLWAVLAREVGTTPPGEQSLQWMLWTNRPTHTAEDAALVVFGYCQRWKVEEFHKTWKSVCRVERNQLHSMAAITRWAIMNAAVAVRIERIKRLSRNEPETPALTEFSRDEIDATILLAKPRGVRLGAKPDLGTFVTWLSVVGGHKPRPSSRHPPGSIVLGRGLERVSILAEALPALRETRCG